MKSVLIAGLLILLPPASAAPRKLQGCSDPKVLAKGLKALSNTKWSRVSISNLQSLWPTHLNATDCDISKTCTSMVHEGRIIDGYVECAEVFDLSLTRNEEGKETERLSDVVVQYTASTRAETVSAARSLSIALGLAARM